MKETILLFQFEETKRRKLAMALMPLRVRVKAVEPGEYGQPIGYLAGVKGIGPVEAEAAKPSGEPDPQTEAAKPSGKPDPQAEEAKLEAEFLVMAGLSGSRVDQVLAAIRKSGAGPIPYKAVLTTTNQNWDAYALLAELRREHEQMTRSRSLAGGEPSTVAS